MMMFYYIDQNREKTGNAGKKAPDDIAEICSRLGFKQLVLPLYNQKNNSFVERIHRRFICISFWKKVAKIFGKDDVILYQYPTDGIKTAMKSIPVIKRKTGCKFIAVIHDLLSLRIVTDSPSNHTLRKNNSFDFGLLKCFDMIICHNEYMNRYLTDNGFDSQKLINLEIFDYLSECDIRQHHKGNIPSVAIAGNLVRDKSGYIYKITDVEENSNLQIHLYGNGFDGSCTFQNIIYHGAFSPEELPEYLEGDFGLVWDGTVAETCGGNIGHYLKYNNPHKTSLYLSSGMPVIVWKQAAIADFVLENNVGIAVESLFDLEETIEAISEENYQDMCKNAAMIGNQIREGRYFETALKKCLEAMGR